MLLFDALLRRAEAGDAPSGYEEVPFRWVLTLGSDGTFRRLSYLETPRVEIVPKLASINKPRSNTAIDSFVYVLGAGAVGGDVTNSMAKAAAYRAMLRRLDHPAATKISQFLADPQRPLILAIADGVTVDHLPKIEAVAPLVVKSPPGIMLASGLSEDPRALGAACAAVTAARQVHANPRTTNLIFCGARGSDRLLIEVEGYPLWWLSPAVVQRHEARLTVANQDKTRGLDSDPPAAKGVKVRKGSPSGADRTAGWGCSICGTVGPLARVFPPSRVLGGMLASFNRPAWTGYGLEQGLNAPTCLECAAGISAGLDAVSAPKGHQIIFRSDSKDDPIGRMVWWAERPDAPPQWPLLSTALDPETTPEDREAALAQIEDGHLISTTIMKNRLALRRYAVVDADRVRANARRWVEILGKSLWAVLRALESEGRAAKTSDALFSAHYEIVLLHLIADEPIPPRVAQRVRALLFEGALALGRHTNRLRADFLRYCNLTPDVEIDMLSEAEIRNYPGPHPDEASWPPRTQAMFNFGRRLGVADRVQRDHSEVSHSLRETHAPLMMSSPLVADVAMQRYGYVRIGGKSRLERNYREFCQRMGHCELPARPTLKEKYAFLRGLYYEDAIYWANRKLLAAERKATDTDTDTDLLDADTADEEVIAAK